jgi:RNA polymerase sigma-70 factor (ECF subfamily)
LERDRSHRRSLRNESGVALDHSDMAAFALPVMLPWTAWSRPPGFDSRRAVAASRMQPPAPTDDDELAALRAGDEAAFAALVDRYGPSLMRVARLYVRTPAVAEEVVQDTWVAVLNGLDRFEGRSSLKTWIFSILANIARTRGTREARSIPFSDLAAREAAADEPAVDPDRFQGAGDPQPGGWAVPPASWAPIPDERLLADETLDRVRDAIAELPPAQRAVIALRDVEGWSSAETRAALDLSEGNQRVLLHRARSRVRAALEDYLS